MKLGGLLTWRALIVVCAVAVAAGAPLETAAAVPDPIGSGAASPLPPLGQPRNQARPAVELVDEWGCNECPGPELFGFVEAVSVTADGTVVALDAYEPVVRKLATGVAAETFGRKGQGPGEFGLGSFLTILPTPAIEVIDTRLRRLTRLDPGGVELASRPMADFPTAASYSASGAAWYLVVMDFLTSSSTVRRLPDGARESRPVRDVDWPMGDDGRPRTWFAFVAGPTGFLIGDGEFEYRIRQYDDRGEPVGDIARSLQRLPKTAEEISRERERLAATNDRRRRMAAAEGATTASLPEPEIDPLRRFFNAHALRYDDSGRLWVLTRRGGLERAVFDVFGADSEYLGEIAVPGDVQRFDLAGSWLATSGWTPQDVPRVRLWRVR